MTIDAGQIFQLLIPEMVRIDPSCATTSGIVGWTSVVYDWLTVALNTIDQS